MTLKIQTQAFTTCVFTGTKSRAIRKSCFGVETRRKQGLSNQSDKKVVGYEYSIVWRPGTFYLRPFGEENTYLQTIQVDGLR